MKSPEKYALIATLVFALSNAHAQSGENAQSQIPAEPDSGEVQASGTVNAADTGASDSDIRIRQAGTTTVKEFHQQGKIYKVEVKPKNTPAYILSDQDGNGDLNSSNTGIESDIVVPEWTIGNW